MGAFGNLRTCIQLLVIERKPWIEYSRPSLVSLSACLVNTTNILILVSIATVQIACIITHLNLHHLHHHCFRLRLTTVIMNWSLDGLEFEQRLEANDCDSISSIVPCVNVPCLCLNGCELHTKMLCRCDGIFMTLKQGLLIWRSHNEFVHLSSPDHGGIHEQACILTLGEMDLHTPEGFWTITEVEVLLLYRTMELWVVEWGCVFK